MLFRPQILLARACVKVGKFSSSTTTKNAAAAVVWVVVVVAAHLLKTLVQLTLGNRRHGDSVFISPPPISLLPVC
jgi:hypothetical protein